MLLHEVRKNASHRRGRLPALMAMGVLFLFVLSACQVAVADDGTVHIRPESTATNSGNTGATGQTGTNNTLANLLTQTGEVDPSTTAPIDPNRVYEWNGVIRWTDLEGGHFAIDRGCDAWAVIPHDDEVYAKLKELVGEKGTVWGTVSRDPNVFGRRAINATSVFASGDVRPAVAMPEIPCPDTPPVPSNHIAVAHGEITLHGDLVWRGGRLWLVTERGNVHLELPRLAIDFFPELDIQSPDAANIDISLGEYGVAGAWDLASTGLVIKVRDIKEWPHRTFVRNHCGGGFHHFVVGDSQLAAHGNLIITDNGEWLLRTPSGVIVVHRNNVAGTDGVIVDPETGEVTEVRPDTLRTHDVVVIGDWKTDGQRLHMEGDKFVRVKTNCEPPQPPRPPILPGEIAALGKLVFENGRPFLNTPSGQIVLLTRRDVNSDPQPADPSVFEDVLPEANTAAGDVVIGEDGAVFADPDVVRPVRQILVVGKWQVRDNRLAIVVRYAIPWPQNVPVPAPEPQPLPPIFELPAPVPPILIDPVEPEQNDDIDKVEPEDESDDDVAEEKRPTNTRPDGANAITASSFTAASAN